MPRPAPESVAALLPPSHIDAGWAIGSYSSLALGARHEAAALDHDLRLLPAGFDTADIAVAAGSAVAATSALIIADDDILRFPRGAEAGECLHAVFEHMAFTEPATWPAAVATALATHPPPWNDAAAAPLGPAMLQHMLADVLHTPLPGGAVLAQVPRMRCLVELEFDLPVPQLGAAALAQALRQHGYATPSLSFGTLRGHLRGFIDLVFEHGGRYCVLDWKSNHLGDSADDYAPASLARAMDRQGYHLQYLLYSVALHRHLQLRVPGYRFETHFGGVLYLFVRGVRPHWPGRGVYAHRPTLQTIEHLSSLLGAPAQATPR